MAQARRPPGVSPSFPTIRHATRDDVDGLLALWERSGAHPSATDTPHDLGRVVDAPHAAVLVAVAGDDALVGSLIATFDGWRGHFYRMVVDPKLRRLGLARADLQPRARAGCAPRAPGD